jgi:Mlc titration factor MtfA (ptsG expression regulator)
MDSVPNYQELLKQNFVVYKMLGENGRRKFEIRVCRFIRMKDFRAGKNIEKITDEMRVMVAASAIQLTYGYPGMYFQHFKTIILYAEEYYSAITGQYHQGEVNAGGAIVLSWNNFRAGFNNLNDGRNLAMHEMAHALRLSNIFDNQDYDFIDSAALLEFENLAKDEISKIEDGTNPFFRLYGGTNLQEFFSVAVECFFEQPQEFNSYNSSLYMLMTHILKMDLLNFTNE